MMDCRRRKSEFMDLPHANQNTPVLIAFPTPDSPISGAVILSREQGAELLAGKLYVDAHGQGYAKGEIRGQIERR